MTDEEIAEKSFFAKEFGYKLCRDERSYKEGFLDGLKADRLQWHDLRKDPDDLPKESMKPSLVKDEFGNLIVAYFSLELKSWWGTPEPDFGIEYEIPVVRWKEIVDD